MNPSNFKDMIDLGEKKQIRVLYNIAIYAQDIEDQLWDGYPYVYPAIRVLIESFFNYIIDTLKKKKLLKISYDYDSGMDLKKLVAHFDQWQAEGEFLDKIEKGIIIQKKSIFSIDAKEQLVRNYLLAMGISESSNENWGTHTLIKNLNTRSHKIDLLNDYSTEDALVIYKNRFVIMETIHEGVFRGFVEAAFSADENKEMSWPMKQYHLPNEDEFGKIIIKYKTRQEKVIERYMNFKC